MVFTPCALLAIQRRILLPGRRDQHLHTLQQVTPGRCQQFQHIIELRGIASSFLHDRQEIAEFTYPKRREQSALARLHPVTIALERIDLPIVSKQTHRLRQRPGGKGIGAVALVKDGEGAGKTFVGQVEIKARQFVRSQQSLVYDGGMRKRDNIAIVDVRLLQALLDQATSVIQDAFIVDHRQVLRTHEQYLLDSRSGGTSALTGDSIIDRWMPPPQEEQSILQACLLDNLATLCVGGGRALLRW